MCQLPRGSSELRRPCGRQQAARSSPHGCPPYRCSAAFWATAFWLRYHHHQIAASSTTSLAHSLPTAQPHRMALPSCPGACRLAWGQPHSLAVYTATTTATAARRQRSCKASARQHDASDDSSSNSDIASSSSSASSPRSSSGTSGPRRRKLGQQRDDVAFCVTRSDLTWQLPLRAEQVRGLAWHHRYPPQWRG